MDLRMDPMDSKDFLWGYDSSTLALHDPGAADDFFKLAPHYDPPALCAEMARLVYCSDLDRVSAALARAGFRDPAWFRDKGTDAFLATNGEVAVLAFRGTEGPKLNRLIDPAKLQRRFQQSGMDWRKTLQGLLAGTLPDMRELTERFLRESQDILTDLDILPESWSAGGFVHRGFAKALERVWDDVAARLDRLDAPVLYTGHSMGAALATLAASLRPPETLYTFGAPTVGDADFAATLDGAVVYRYVNCCDIVCRLPPALYDPVGSLRYIDCHGRLTDTEDGEADKLSARGAHFQRVVGQWDKVWMRDLADHAAVNYVKALLANRKKP